MRRRTKRSSRGHRHAGFIIFFGWRNIISRDRREPVLSTCRSCGQSAYMMGMSYRKWFTLFFIPVLPLSASQKFCQCSVCGAQFDLDLEAFTRHGIEPAPSYEQAIALFNEMRETPNDSQKLLRMMTAYCQMGEYSEALSSAKCYPFALGQSDECLTMAARACAEMGDVQQAIQWCDRALAINHRSAAGELRSQLRAGPVSGFQS